MLHNGFILSVGAYVAAGQIRLWVRDALRLRRQQLRAGQTSTGELCWGPTRFSLAENLV